MALRLTFHEIMSVTDPNGRPLSILGKQIGGEAIAVSVAVANSAPATKPCIAHMKAGENCFVAFGQEDAAEANIALSFPLDAGERDTRLLGFGDVVSVIAA